MFHKLKYLILFCSVFLLASCSSQKEHHQVKNIRSVKTMIIKDMTAVSVRRIPGVVEASDITHMSFQIAGTVETVDVGIGDYVKKGQILASLDETPYELQVHAAAADLAKARATMLSKKQHYLAKSKLVKTSVISSLDANTAKADYEAAESTVKVAEVKLKLAKRDLDHTVLRAPFNGIVAERSVDAHSEIAAGKTLFIINKYQSFDVKLSFPSSLIQNLKIGQVVNISVPSLEKNGQLTGKIYRIGLVSLVAHAYPIKIRIIKPPHALKVGMAAEVSFNFKRASGAKYIIPYHALLPGEKANQAYVFLYDPKTSTVKKTLIYVGDVHNNEVVVDSGLKQDDSIVVAGVTFLHDGEQVRLLKAEDGTK